MRHLVNYSQAPQVKPLFTGCRYDLGWHLCPSGSRDRYVLLGCKELSEVLVGPLNKGHQCTCLNWAQKKIGRDYRDYVL